MGVKYFKSLSNVTTINPQQAPTKCFFCFNRSISKIAIIYYCYS